MNGATFTAPSRATICQFSDEEKASKNAENPMLNDPR